MQASMRLKNWSHLNLTDLLPAGVSFTDPMFFDNEASNITSSSKVLPCLQPEIQRQSTCAAITAIL